MGLEHMASALARQCSINLAMIIFPQFTSSSLIHRTLKHLTTSGFLLRKLFSSTDQTYSVKPGQVYPQDTINEFTVDPR